MAAPSGDTGVVPSLTPWRLVVPIKDAALAKTRLEPPAPLTRAALARAMARDTLEAVCRALPPPAVVVVTSDRSATQAALALGAVVVPDPGAGLNAAVSAGLAAATGRTASPGERPARVGVLLGDLPTLRPEDLLQGLTACADHAVAVVPDAEGTGTVLLTAAPGGVLVPGFGPGSAARHAALPGALLLPLDLPRLRRDVDDAPALACAARLGLGRHTAQLLATTGGADGPHRLTRPVRLG